MKEKMWLVARYRFASAYSCRMPMSSPMAARALPTPGPATVRLALIRNAIELFGILITRDVLFPVIRGMAIRIQPPNRVAISWQQIKLYKGSTVHRSIQIQEGIGYHEVATADGSLDIYLQIDREVATPIEQTLYAVGAWGSADSLACCELVSEAEPPANVVVPMQAMRVEDSLSRRFIGIATEFRDQHVTWEETDSSFAPGMPGALSVSLWVWPLNICEQRSNGMILRR